MPIELPMFEEGQGIMLCICGKLEPSDSVSVPQGPEVFKYTTPQGDAFAQAEIEGETKLFIHCARLIWFGESQLPKATTKKKSGLSQIVESAYGLKMKATICASFRVPLLELPESGLIRSFLVETKGPTTSIRMNGASFVLTGTPFGFLRWRSVNTKSSGTVVYIDIKGKRELQVSEKLLTNLWRRIYAEFTVWVLGGGETNMASDSK